MLNRMPNRSDNGWYKINNRAKDAEADVYLYAEIGDSFFGDSVSASQFAKDVAGLDVKTINLHVNSPGGDIFDGIAIANTLRQHDAKVVATVDGIAASAASFILMAADEVVMGQYSELMIHDAWGIVVGNSDDMTEAAGLLNKASDNIAQMYADRTGGDVASWRNLMKTETWFSAQEAVDAKLADRVLATDKEDADQAKAKFDLTIFNHAGREAAGPPLALMNSLVQGIPTASPAEPVSINTPSTEGVDTMSDTLTSGLRERLGISADTELDEEGLLAALDEKLTVAEPQENQAHGLPQGVVTVDSTVLEELQASARLGREAREQQIVAGRNALVDAAVADGRISPARRQAWLDTLTLDPGAEESLKALTPGLIPLAPKGYTGGVEPSSDDDAYPATWKL